MAKKTLSIKIDEAVLADIDREAAKKEWTRSYYAESILKKGMKKVNRATKSLQS
jgi:hypothetical protein